jgi:RNA 2',3'-cyclic 3'-phosphodiesterase
VRLFVALDVPDAVRADVSAALADAQAVAPAGMRWSDPARWHLTLAFLGEVADSRVKSLTERLGRTAARHDAPTLLVSGAGRFDGRVLWAAVREPLAAAGRLVPLASSVAAAARHSGIEVEDRTYRAHLTVGRCATPTDLRGVVEALGALRSAEWTPASVLLVRSRLGPAPEHTVLAELPLRRPAPFPPRTGPTT